MFLKKFNVPFKHNHLDLIASLCTKNPIDLYTLNLKYKGDDVY